MTILCKWNSVKLGALADFKNGLNYSKENMGDGMKVIGVSDFQDYSVPRYDELEQINPDGVVREADLLEEGDILFVRSNGNRNLIGRSLLIHKLKEKVSHSGFTIRLRFNSDAPVCVRYYAHVFRTSLIRAELSARGGGTNINNLNQQILNNLEVPLPPLKVQGKIASVLSAYDDLIENNRRRIAILEEMARNLYREWFVKFRFPLFRKDGTIERLHDPKRAPMQDSPLGSIPQGWEVTQLIDAASLTMGQSPESKFYNTDGHGLPFHQGVTDFGSRFPSTRVYSTEGTRKAHAGDILFSVRAPVGRINISTETIILGRGLAAIRSKNDHQVYLFYQLDYVFREEDTIGNGAIFKAVTKEDMQTIKLIQSPPELISLFEQQATPVFNEIGALSRKIDNLILTRDHLLPKLISGQVDVSELDIAVPTEFV